MNFFRKIFEKAPENPQRKLADKPVVKDETEEKISEASPNSESKQELADESTTESRIREEVIEILPDAGPSGKKYRSTPTEKILERREKSSSKKLGGGAFETIFVELKDDGAGVFKPKQDPKDEMYKCERAAYLVDRFLGFELVPPTTIREIDGRVGSLQQFIYDAKMGIRLCPEEMERLSDDERVKLNLFDFLIQNADRHGANFLVKDGRIIAIDHGLSFLNSFNPQFCFDHRKRPLIPQETRDKILKLNSLKDMKAILTSLLLEILPPENVKSFLERLERLAQLLEDSNWRYDQGVLNQMNSYSGTF